MSLQTAAGPINAEDADNFEEIEKQFAVKGIQWMAKNTFEEH